MIGFVSSDNIFLSWLLFCGLHIERKKNKSKNNNNTNNENPYENNSEEIKDEELKMQNK